MSKDNRGSKQINKGRTTPIKRGHNSRKEYNDLLSKTLNDFMKKGDWDSIVKVLELELAKTPDDHWLLAEIASAYYEKKDYDTAYKFIIEAVPLQEDCPHSLWHLASIIRMRDQQEDAITIWKELINRGEERLAYDECGEGLKKARSLIADCKYMISKTYRELGNEELAKIFKEDYLIDIAKGVTSIYDPHS
jgi:tetratricopeptide (TPR) repeat protein